MQIKICLIPKLVMSSPLLAQEKDRKKAKGWGKENGDVQKTNFFYHKSHLCQGHFKRYIQPLSYIHQSGGKISLVFRQHCLRKFCNKGDLG